MIGVSDRVGSLEPGKDADFLVLNGDPLDLKTRITAVYINGEKVFGLSLDK
jgi:imidazolonepropionase-like amidohydrolase